MRNFTANVDWSGLLVEKNLRFFDIISKTFIRPRNVRWWVHSDPRAIACIDMLEENGVSYIIAGSNEQAVALRNHWRKVLTRGKSRIYLAWTYRIKDIKHDDATLFDSLCIKHPYYTVFNRKDFYDLLCLVSDGWFVLEKDVKKNKIISNTYKKGLTRKEIILVWHVKLYSNRIRELSTKDDPTSQDLKELEMYADVNQYNAIKIQEALQQNYWGTMAKIKKLVKWQTNYREVINSFHN